MDTEWGGGGGDCPVITNVLTGRACMVAAMARLMPSDQSWGGMRRQVSLGAEASYLLLFPDCPEELDPDLDPPSPPF